MSYRHLKTTLSVVALAAAAIGSAQNTAFGIDFSGRLYKVDVTTGIGSLFTSTGLVDTNCLAYFSSEWYTVDNQARLWRLQESGVPALVYTMDLGGATDVRGLALDANAKMYVVVNATGSDQLWSVSPGTGVGTLVGNMGSTTIQGLAVAFNGKLYAYDTSSTTAGGLKVVDIGTGFATDLDPSAPGQPGIQDIAPSGANLFGGRDSLFSVGQTTGQETLIGTGGYSDIRGWARKQTSSALTGLTIRLGQLTGGGISSLAHRDGKALVVNKFFVPNQQVDPINVEVTFANGLDHTDTLDAAYMWVGRTNTSGPFRLTVDIFNRATNQWETLRTHNISNVTSENFASTRGDLVPYYQGSNQVLLRYRVKPVGPIGSSNWGIETDMFRFEEVERF